MAALPLIASIGMTVASGIYTAKAQEAEGKVEKQLYDYRAAIAEENRIYETRLGVRKAAELGLRQAQETSRVRLPKGDIEVGTGSAAEVEKSQRIINRIEQQDVLDAAARRAFNERVSGELSTAAGKQAEWAGKTKAKGTYLTMGTNVASKWYQASSSGMGGGGSGSSPLQMDVGFQGWNPYATS